MNRFEKAIEIYQEVINEFESRLWNLNNDIKKSLKDKLIKSEIDIELKDNLLNILSIDDMVSDPKKLCENMNIEKIIDYQPNQFYSDSEKYAYFEGFEARLQYQSDVINPYKKHKYSDTYTLFCAWCSGYEDCCVYIINLISKNFCSV